MRRQTVYPGAVPLETDILNTNKNVMIAIGHLIQDMLGTSTLFSGLGCVPTSPAGMTVNVNPGRAYSYQATDTGAYSSLAADAHQIVKQGILLDALNFSCPAPTTAGFSQNYLIEAAFQEIDAGSTVLPYYNASNPAQAYSGPNGTGASNTTYRDNTVQVQVKPGAAATTGSQITPTPDTGFNGLWVVMVPFGATTITSAMISQYTGAPFLSQPLLPQIQSAPVAVGATKNLVCSITAASQSATFVDTEIIVETALGGQTYKLANFNKTVNIGTVGLNGMDTGAPTSGGKILIYAIYNPTTGVSGVLAQNEGSALAPPVYGGANMPAGFTASALISILLTTGTNFQIQYQRGRKVSFVGVSVLSTAATTGTTPVAFSLSPLPWSSVRWSGFTTWSSTAASVGGIAVNGSPTNGVGNKSQACTVTAGAQNAVPVNDVDIIQVLTAYYTGSSSAGTATFQATVNQYEF